MLDGITKSSKRGAHAGLPGYRLPALYMRMGVPFHLSRFKVEQAAEPRSQAYALFCLVGWPFSGIRNL